MGITHRIIGYHGTNKKSGDNIIREKTFYPSTKPTEWLGNGIYLWAYRSDAVWWSIMESSKPQNTGYPPVIIVAELAVAEEQFLDLDDSAQFSRFCAEIAEIAKDADGYDFADARIARCFWANYYAAEHNIELIAYTFSTYRADATGFNRVNKKQYCVMNSDIIVNIKMEEVNDYAV